MPADPINGRLSLERTPKSFFEILLVDKNLPGIDGLQLASITNELQRLGAQKIN